MRPLPPYGMEATLGTRTSCYRSSARRISGLLLLYPLFLLFLLMAALAPGNVRAADAPGQEALGRMRAFDAAATGSFTLDLELARYHHAAKPEQGMMDARVQLATDGAAWAMLQESRYRSDPQYRPAGGEYQAAEYDREGNLLVWRDTRIQAYIGSDLAGNRTELTLYRVTPSNQVAAMEEGAPAVLLVAPADASDFINVKYLLWAAGRGFGREVHDLLGSAAKADGAVELTASGAVGNVGGTWRIAVDPANAYLAREATFTADGHDRPLVVCRTTGARWFGDLVIPERAEISLQGDGPEAMVHVTFTGIARGADSAVMGAAERAVRGPYAKNTDVTDYRDRAKGPSTTRTE